ncbi:response regulator [Mesorhizobium sp. NBSH29]|uniref:response regulator n=1 Tax=Mesorhizobium sp. NBSH29 TaxID=2654249 RepID=UPI0018967425|nr:response regulator [Mesorhizobium sp. NBSH29]QPC85716.1 response regulator [Mesorhizobium sp. NBSH29]
MLEDPLSNPLNGLHILVLEDEFLIAMDVEQLCRDSGARDVTIVRDLEDLSRLPEATETFDAAIVDLMLSGNSTLEFAAQLRQEGVPFVFASGYSNSEEVSRDFPDVDLVGKPYAGDDLISALVRSIAKSSILQSSE